MEGVMNPHYVAAMSDLGWVDAWITPFLRLGHGLPKRVKFQRFINPFLVAGVPVTVQLMGLDANLLGDAARVIYDLNEELPKSHPGVVGFDLNCACPSRQVVKSGSGGNLLRSPLDMVHQLREVKRAVPEAFVEVKVRTGFSDWREMRQFIPMLVDEGVDLLHVHFRTVEEGYRSVSGGGLERLGEAVQLAGQVPISASGDIFSIEDAERVVRETGCAGVLAARGLLKDPFLIRRIEGDLEKSDQRLVFFNALLVAARQREVAPNKGVFMENAAWMFGAKSHFFKNLTKMTVPEILGLQVDRVVI
jgi:tRNA-dihydrouridine synthase C